MANGLLGKTLTAAGTNVLLCTIPSGVEYTTLNVMAVNEGNEYAEFYMAITDQETPSAVDYVEYGAVLPSKGGIYERTAIVASPGEKIFVRSDCSSIAVRANGISKVA